MAYPAVSASTGRDINPGHRHSSPRGATWMVALGIASVLLVLTGCASGSSYRELGESGPPGYSVRGLPSGEYEVMFQGGRSTSATKVRDLAKLRAAEYTRELGAAHFLLTGERKYFVSGAAGLRSSPGSLPRGGGRNISVVTGASSAAPRSSGPIIVAPDASREVRIYLRIRIVRPDSPVIPEGSLNAAEVAREIRGKYRSK